jgi:cytoskeletal protein RodZ
MAEPKFQESKHDLCKDFIAARESRELDLIKVSERTKISFDYLTKIESGDWGFLPSSYVRAFLRTYAQTVGMDVGEVLQRFDQISGSAPATQQTLGISEPDSGKRSRVDSGSSSPKFTLADEFNSRRSGFEFTPPIVYGGIAVIVIAILIVIYIFLIAPKLGENRQSVQEIPFDEVVRETQVIDSQADPVADSLIIEGGAGDVEEGGFADGSLTGADQTSTQQPETSPSALLDPQNELNTATLSGSSSLTLHVNVNQACYMRVIADHDTSNIFDTILSTGTSRDFNADSLFRVVVGNTNGVELLLNGRILRNVGARGRVVTLTIDQSGIRQAEAGNQELRGQN